jgi:molybdopterin-containing oxidoreductase family molybdopterin binding subunit
MAEKARIHEDVWIPTQCARCYGACGILVHRVNGVAVKIEGNPGSSMGGEGGLCAKGEAGLQVLYDPNRLNVPLRRTNPEKGLFVDPKWKEISWEEAFDEILPRLKKIINENPKKLLIQFTIIRSPGNPGADLAFRYVMKQPPISTGGGSLQCGMGAHVVGGLVHAAWSIVPDFKYCNYAIYFGANKGSGSGHSAMMTTYLAAEARARGMRFVVFDPMCNFAGGKANEWVPILPGTDAAVALAMCNIILNELGIYDEIFLKTKTNAPYLIGPDKQYVRDGASNKPLVWDPVEGNAKTYDDPAIKDYALTGEYKVNGDKCNPAFHIVKDHLKHYTPEMASKISTVPAQTIRRIATEFAQAAQVGSTITIDGHQLPFRPVSAVLFRGGEGHENSHHTCWAASLLNQIVGAADVPGGTLGWPARSMGYPGTGKLKWAPVKGKDGFITFDHFGPFGGMWAHESPWPFKMPENRHQLNLLDIFTLAPFPFVMNASDQEELWQKVGAPVRPEMMLSFGCNSVMSTANREIIAGVLKKIPFIAVHELFNNEFTEGFADIVLPATCYLEESSWAEGMSGQNFNHPFGMRDWSYHIMQPVVEPKFSRRSWPSFLFELIDRVGKREEFNNIINSHLDLTEENKLGPTEKFTPETLGNKVVKSLFGPEHDWSWFKEYGFMRWPKKVEEVYWRYFIDARSPIYLEYMVDIGEKIKEITEGIGLDVDFTQYTPLISWTPCSIHRVDKPEYDLYCFSYRDVLHTGSHTMEQPWLDEASRMNPYTYNITMNADTAKGKGLKDGDTVELESIPGRKVEGRLKLLKGMHPQTVSIAACSGHWAKGMPIAKDKGVNFDILLELDLKHVDPVSFNMETAVRIKIRKVEEQGGR